MEEKRNCVELTIKEKNESDLENTRKKLTREMIRLENIIGYMVAEKEF